MRCWKFTLVLETEANTEEEAVANIQQELSESANEHPSNIGDWEEISVEPIDPQLPESICEDSSIAI